MSQNEAGMPDHPLKGQPLPRVGKERQTSLFKTAPFFLLKKYFIYLAVPGPSCSVRDLWSSLLLTEFLVEAMELLVAMCGVSFPDQGANLCPPAVEVWIPNHRTTMEFLIVFNDCVILHYIHVSHLYRLKNHWFYNNMFSTRKWYLGVMT